jgi:hypothetical protein
MATKKYKIKKTKALIKKLKPYWNEADKESTKYYKALEKIEKKASKELEIEGLEFFFSDNDLVGIGNEERNMELVHDSDFKKELK